MTDVIKTKIAILGSTGYIGRSLLASGLADGRTVIPVSRDALRARETLATYGVDSKNILTYDEFRDQDFDIIVNATGIGSPKEITKDPKRVFDVTEAMDKALFSYLEQHPYARIFSISSGSVYGRQSDQVIKTGSLSIFDPAHFSPGDHYSLAKLCSEAKHRAWVEYSVIDLRVFAFVSRWLNPNESFFISEVSKCLLEDETLVTMPNDMVRDYSTANDIWNVIDFLCSTSPTNSVFDMQSQSPVTKFEMLDRLRDKFGLRYQVDNSLRDQSPTGPKNTYCSQSDALFKLGFIPARTALENIEIEIGALLSTRK